jgi:branched-chain amino acid transport system permease protein
LPPLEEPLLQATATAVTRRAAALVLSRLTPKRYRAGAGRSGRSEDAIEPYVAFLLLGLGAGAVYATLAMGLVLVHRATGIVSFAQGAMAMYTTYVYAELRDTGDLVLPVVGVPHRIGLGGPLAFAPALAVCLLVAALLGLLVHLLVFRPLRGAPPLAKVVASVGLMVVLQALATLQFGSDNRFLSPLLPHRPRSLLGVQVPEDRLLLAGLVVLVALALGAVYRWTVFGLSTRAAAEDEQAAALLGYSPDRIAAANWVAASVLAALGGVLVAPITALNPLTYTLFVVPALAAALVGRMTSFTITAVAALALGMAQSELVTLQADWSWLRDLNLRAGLPFLVIVVVMASRGALIPDRSTAAALRLPTAGRPSRPLLAAAATGVPAAVALVVLSGSWRLGLIHSLIAAIVCLSVVVLTGYVGQLSLAQLALAGVAGFSLSRLQTSLHVPFPVAPLVAASCAGAVGLLVGLASRRVRGIDLAVVTLAAGVAVEELVFKNAAVTGGLGGSRVPPPEVAGLDLAISGPGAAYPRLGFGLLALAVLVACALAVSALRRGPLGRRMLAVRVNERGAEAAGVDVARTKLLAFVLASFLAGLAGALLGYQQGQLSFESFGVLASLSYLAAAYLGGVARISGALVGGLLVPGGLLFTALDHVAGLEDYALLLSGLAVLVTAVLAPEGLTGLASRLRTRSS